MVPLSARQRRAMAPLVAAAAAGAAACYALGVAAVLASPTPIAATTYTPRSYYRFEDSFSPGEDSMGAFDLEPGTANGTLSVNCTWHAYDDGGQVGAYYGFNDSNTSHFWGVSAGPFPNATAAAPVSGLTVEMLVRFDRLFLYSGNTTFFSSADPPTERAGTRVEAAFERHRILWRADTAAATGSTGTPIDSMIVDLTGLDRKSPMYYVNSTRWHHLAFRKNAATGEQSVWVDGLNPWSFRMPGNATKRVMAPRAAGPTKAPLLLLPSAYGGAIDEVAVYETAVSDSLIYQHYTEAMAHQPYTWVDGGKAPPAPPQVNGTWDLKEFAPGTIIPTPVGNSTQGVTLTMAQQLKAYPAPRFQTVAAPYAFHRIFNWGDPHYQGGQGQPGLNRSTVAANALEIQTELGTTWNYAPNIPGQSCCPDNGTIALMNANPAWGADAIIFRAGAHGRSQLYNQTLPAACYLQDKSGNLLDYTGARLASGAKKVLRPTSTANQASVCPDSIFAFDSTFFVPTFQKMVAAGIKAVTRVNEDGEMFVLNECATIAYDMDPVVAADYDKNSKIPPLPTGERDWLSYVSQWRTRVTTQFRDGFLKYAPGGGATYSEYQVQGDTRMLGKWKYLREVGSPLGGRHYSTVDFYPWNQATKKPVWDVGQGAWHGIDWMTMTRPSEIAAGDVVNSPFIAAGWDPAEEFNIRPAQWLGLVKSLVLMGAEWFYFGFFSLSKPFPRSQNWAWQAATPSYAQAMATYWPDALFNGTLLPAPAPEPPLECLVIVDNTEPVGWGPPVNGTTCYAPGSPPVNYRWWAGSTNVVVLIRAAPPATPGGNATKWVIAATIQPESSQVGNTPVEATASVDFNGHNLTFSVRRQGSMYVLDNSTGAVKWTQLDGWHEATHPSYWSPSFAMEAELHDAFSSGSSGVELGSELAPTAAHRTDFVGVTTYATIPPSVGVAAAAESAVHRYSFTPRPRDALTGAPVIERSYDMWVRARTSGAAAEGARESQGERAGTACVSASVLRASDDTGPIADGTSARAITACTTSPVFDWCRVTLDTPMALATGAVTAPREPLAYDAASHESVPHVLRLTGASGASARGIDVDKVLLTEANARGRADWPAAADAWCGTLPPQA